MKETKLQHVKDEILVVIMEKGDDIMKSLQTVCTSYNIKAGFVWGIGAVSRAEIGYFDLNLKKYLQISLDENLELLNALGNVSIDISTNEVIIHVHAMLGRQDGTVLGGHLFPGSIISVTGEFWIQKGEGILERSINTETGLKLLS